MLLPRLSLSTSTGTSALDSLSGPGGASLSDLGETWVTRFTLSQPVVDATTIFGLVGGFQQNGVSRAQSRQTMAALILDVQNAYYNLAASRALVSSAQRQHERAAENAKIVARRYQLGGASKADKLRAEAGFLSAEAEVLSSQVSLEANQRILCDLAGMENWQLIGVDELPDARDPGSLPTTVISSALLERNPDLDVLHKQVRSSDLAYWGAWGALLPSLSFTAGKSFSQDEILPSFSEFTDAAPTYGLSVSFPIVDLKGRLLGISRARLNRKSSRLNLAQQELAFRQRLAMLLATQSSSYAGWEFASKNIEVSSEVYRLTSRSYELGASSLADLLAVQAELVQAERAQVQAKAKYWSARAELNYFLGNSISHDASVEDR